MMMERGTAAGAMTGAMVARHSMALRLCGALALLALLGVVAGCGATTGPGGEQGVSSSPSPTGATQSAAASPTATSRRAPTTTTTSSSAVACPASDQGLGNPALILTPTTPNRSGAAHVGDMVQVRLPTTTKWTFQSSQPTGMLTTTQPSGVLIHSVNACVWSFQAASAGTVSLPFIGQAICEPGKPCPNYRIAMTFTVTIS